METLKIILTFLGAVFGGFIGAAFKELIADRFFHRNKKRDLKSKLIKRTIIFFRLLKKHVDVFNGAEIHKQRINLLKEKSRDKSLSEDDREKIQNDIDGMFRYIQDLHSTDSRLFAEITETESEILSIVVECENYFKEYQYKQLRKSLWAISKEGSNNLITVQGYLNLDYSALVAFQNSKYEKEIYRIGVNTDKRLEYYIDHINEILN